MVVCRHNLAEIFQYRFMSNASAMDVRPLLKSEMAKKWRELIELYYKKGEAKEPRVSIGMCEKCGAIYIEPIA